jgi:hypothetical protein
MKKQISKWDSAGCIAMIFIFLIVVAGFIGEIRCFVKAYKCNWEPIGKAEIIYTAAAFTGLGAIVGYLEIEDK